MGFKLSDPLGTKRRGKKKERAANEAARKTREAGEELFGDKGLLATKQAASTEELNALRGRVSGTLADSASRATSALDAAEGGALNRFQTARGEISNLFGEARSTFNPFIKTGQDASQSLSKALGLGGQGFDSSFLASTPGFQHRLQQGQESLISGSAAAGLTDSSKTRQGLVKFGSNLAGESFDTFIQQLIQTSGQGIQAAGASGDLASTQGKLTGNLFEGEAGVIERTGVNRANIATDEGFRTAEFDRNITAAAQAEELGTATKRTAGLLGTRTGAIDAELAGRMASINAGGENVANLISIAGQGASLAVGGPGALLATKGLDMLGGQDASGLNDLTNSTA